MAAVAALPAGGAGGVGLREVGDRGRERFTHHEPSHVRLQIYTTARAPSKV